MLKRPRAVLTALLVLGGGGAALSATGPASLDPAATVTSATPARAPAADTVVHVHKSPTCGCCTAWEDHLRAHGFTVASHPSSEGLAELRATSGVPAELGSCHTATVGGYVVEGHVPAEAVKRLLAERPDAVGLAVPGMPVGSPGMEHPDGHVQPHDVLLVKHDGSTERWQHVGS